MEQFSLAYCHAVIATAGYSMASPRPDVTKVDFDIRSDDVGGICDFAQLNVQLKSTSTDSADPDALRYALDATTYNKLCHEKVMVPRILVVVVLPQTTDQWLSQSHAELAVRRCGYWVSLRGLPRTTNTSSKTVSLPRSQVFSVPELRRIFAKLGNGEDL